MTTTSLHSIAPPQALRSRPSMVRSRRRGARTGLFRREPRDYQTNWQTIQIGTKWWGLSAARLYDFAVGTFISRDFLPYLNKYRAFSNNPIMQVDRDGLADIDRGGNKHDEMVNAQKEKVKSSLSDVLDALRIFATGDLSKHGQASQESLENKIIAANQKNEETALPSVKAYVNAKARLDDMQNLAPEEHASALGETIRNLFSGTTGEGQQRGGSLSIYHYPVWDGSKSATLAQKLAGIKSQLKKLNICLITKVKADIRATGTDVNTESPIAHWTDNDKKEHWGPLYWGSGEEDVRFLKDDNFSHYSVWLTGSAKFNWEDSNVQMETGHEKDRTAASEAFRTWLNGKEGLNLDGNWLIETILKQEFANSSKK